MRPLSLRIQGLRSFREEVAIDFGDRRQIAVVGDTGAGKSSILEATTYALYGKTSFAHANQDLMNDASDTMRVVLRFRVSHEEWDVARTLRRDGKGDVKPSGARLRRLGKDGEPLELVEQVRPVNERIEQLIGLDSDAFLRTVILPQGRFARLLVEDRPAKRSEVLRQLWPTPDLEGLGDLAARALKDVEKTRAKLEQEANAHPEDPEARLAELRATAEAARRKADEAAELAEEASRACRSMEAAGRDGKLASKERDRLERGLPQIDEAEARIAPLAEILREIDKADEAAKRKRAGLRDELGRIPAEDGPDMQEVVTALAKLETFVDSRAAVVKADEEMRNKAKRADERRGGAVRARDATAKAADEADRHGKQRPPLAKAAEAAADRREEARRGHQGCEALRRRAEEAAGKVAELANRRDGLAAQAKNAAEEAERAEAAAAEAKARLAAAERAAASAAAAHGLRPGDDCPVCLRGLPENWSAPEDAGHADAAATARQAGEAAQKKEGSAKTARAEMQSLERQLSDEQVDRTQALEEYETARAALVAQFGDVSADAPAEGTAGVAGPRAPDDAANARAADGASPLPSLDALLRTLEATRRKASDALARHDDQHKALRDEQVRLAKEAEKAKAEAKAADEQAEDARRRAEEAQRQLARNVSEIPSPYRPQAPREPSELAKVDPSAAQRSLEAARKRLRVLKQREQRRGELDRKLDEAGKELQALALRRRAEVEKPLGAAAEPLGRARDAVLRALDVLDLRDAAVGADLPGAPSEFDPAAHQAWLRNLRDRTEAVAEAARTRAKKAARDKKEARDVLDDVGRRLADPRVPEEPSADTTASAVGTPVSEVQPSPDDVRSAAAAARDDAEHDARTAARDRDDFAAIKDDVLALRALLDEAGGLERALSDLDKALKPGAFPKWLTLRRSRSLLVHASRRLREISRKKYAFAEPENDDAQWSVLDEHSGQLRSPASLSGGEQFIASLALALGMVEMTARSGGRLESLFLDEGFGALDRHNLDAAVEALGAVASSGRMVGVISHVRAVAEQIDHVLVVERTPSGSRAKWLSRRERQGLSASDARSEVSAAYGGLV